MTGRNLESNHKDLGSLKEEQLAIVVSAAFCSTDLTPAPAVPHLVEFYILSLGLAIPKNPWDS